MKTKEKFPFVLDANMEENQERQETSDAQKLKQRM